MVASGIRCKSDGRGSGFMVMLGDDTDIPDGVAILGSGYFAWPELAATTGRRQHGDEPHPGWLAEVGGSTCPAYRPPVVRAYLNACGGRCDRPTPRGLCDTQDPDRLSRPLPSAG